MSAGSAVLLAGATGLVGGLALRRWLARGDGPLLVAPVRRPLDVDHPRLLALPGGWDEKSIADALATRGARLDAYACCLGTTIRQAGSREAFLEVDRDLVLSLAGIARRLGARQALMVSSVGASAQSDNFYLRVKGETERALGELGFERLDLLRPGLLLGERSEKRAAEQWGQRLAPLFNPLLRGALRRYRAIAAADVAAAAVAVLSQGAGGRHVHENAGLLALARA